MADSSADRRFMQAALALAGRGREGPEEKSFTLAKDAEVLLDSGRGSRFVMKEGKLGDVHPQTGVVADFGPFATYQRQQVMPMQRCFLMHNWW